MSKNKKPQRTGAEAVIRLEDLVPRKDPKGGKAGPGKTVFGGGPVISAADGPDPGTKTGRREK